MDYYETIEKKVKDFCEKQYSDASKEKTVKEILNIRAIAFGALMFACNNLFPRFNGGLSDWWNDEMWGKFENLITEIYKKERQ